MMVAPGSSLPDGVGLIYIRQSRHKGYEATVSPQVQEEGCRGLPPIATCSVVEVYRDLDVSGGKIKGRRGWLALRDRLEGLRKGDRVVLAVYDQSRAFRSTADALELYALLEQRPWVEVAFVKGSFDRSPAGEFTYTAMAAAHAMERRMTAEKIRDAKRYHTARGEAVGPLPAGYRWEGQGAERYVVIDEALAPLVRRVFADYATGRYSARDLAHRLNAEGSILPARTGPKEHRGKGWYGDTITQLLGNVAYIGKTYSVSRRFREGDLIDAKWPALVDRATWDAAQRQRVRNHRRGGDSVVGRERRNYAFQRLLSCVCGRRMSVHTVGRFTYYRCRGHDAPDRCAASMAREDRLLTWAQDLMTRLDRLAPQAVRERARALDEERPVAPDALSNVEESLRRADFMFYTAKRWDEAHYLAELARLTAIRGDLAAAVPSCTDRPPLDFTGVLDAWESGDPITRRQLLGTLFDALNVEDGRVVSYIPRADRAAEVASLVEYVASAEREGFGSPATKRGAVFS